SFLSKGPVAFYAVLLPFLISFIASYGIQPVRAKWKEVTIALFICLAISSWWYLYIYFSHPELASFVAKKESGAWIGHNVKPWYHYWSFPVQSGIWTIAIVAALIFPYASSKIKTVANYKFIALWVWSSVILLSLMPEKKERYLLPVLLPAGLLAAAYFRYLIQAFSEKKATSGDKIFLNINAIVLGGIATLIPVGLYILSKKGIDIPVWQIGLYGIIFLTVGISFFSSLRKKNVFAVWGLMVGFMLLFNLFLLPMTKDIVISNRDYKSIAQMREDLRLKELPFYYNGDTVRMEIVWEAGRVIRENNFKKNLQPLKQLPIVMVSSKKVEEFLPDTTLSRLDCEIVGQYDNNLGKKKKDDCFLNYVTIIKAKREHP
ncbi:MAG: hypothetical protein Q8862_02585, partial [Bacteroidota bacterium]|nr:hypothetical protein [Bacteroidota bacterium]